jgi:hypothetical protein
MQLMRVTVLARASTSIKTQQAFRNFSFFSYSTRKLCIAHPLELECWIRSVPTAKCQLPFGALIIQDRISCHGINAAV